MGMVVQVMFRLYLGLRIMTMLWFINDFPKTRFLVWHWDRAEIRTYFQSFTAEKLQVVAIGSPPIINRPIPTSL